MTDDTKAAPKKVSRKVAAPKKRGRPRKVTAAPQPPVPTEQIHHLRRLTRLRIDTQLTAMYKVVGPLNREQLGAMMDGAQEAVMEWLPPTKGKPRG